METKLYTLSTAEQSQGQLRLGWAGLRPSATPLMMTCWHLLLKHMFGLSRRFPPPSGLPPRFLTHSLLSWLFKKQISESNVSADSLEVSAARTGSREWQGRSLIEGLRVSGCRVWERAKMGDWRWPGPTLMPTKTQPPQHESSLGIYALVCVNEGQRATQRVMPQGITRYFVLESFTGLALIK